MPLCLSGFYVRVVMFCVSGRVLVAPFVAINFSLGVWAVVDQFDLKLFRPRVSIPSLRVYRRVIVFWACI